MIEAGSMNEQSENSKQLMFVYSNATTRIARGVAPIAANGAAMRMHVSLGFGYIFRGCLHPESDKVKILRSNESKVICPS